jgi:hypothetical protein
MTKSTLKAIATSGGLIATWFAFTPPGAMPAKSSVAAVERAAPAREVTAEDLNAQEARLRQRAANVELGAATRNPFRFGARSGADTPSHAGIAAAPAALPVVAPAQPALNLSGIAERTTPQGHTRTAIISGGGQLYLVTDGEMVAGRYRVVTVDTDAVTLRDESGAETRLVLH